MRSRPKPASRAPPFLTISKLKNDELVTAEREKAFIRYRANTAALEEVLGFLYAECCTRNKAVEPRKIVALCK